ncbi:MAG: hypothetical protein LQ340_002309 [Diploschistes diacapsis]|nr:MAG: hypothetical protein LQ340_002309 [Diploschistes diacapsis]
MNVNKRLDRLKQWAGERMGGDVRTTVSDDFKSLEIEMGLRYDGMKANHNAMNAYVKSISKRSEGDEKDKVLPIGLMGSAMAAHGEDFEPDSEFGQCLIAMGRSNERIARIEEGYISKASSSWLDSLERSVAQMKEYAVRSTIHFVTGISVVNLMQAARKKLESRRLAYDTAAAKMEKAKREDFRSEEELRSQKAKYDEATEDVYRRMMDIKEAESDSVLDLTEFLEAELSYHERCREVLMQLKRDWPAGLNEPSRRYTRSRSNTGGSGRDQFNHITEENEAPPPQPPRPAIRPNRLVSGSVPQSPAKEVSGCDFGSNRPGVYRATTYDMSSRARDTSPASLYSMHRVPSDSLSIRNQRSQLRSVSRLATDTAADNSDASTYYSNDTNSPDRLQDESGASSYGSVPSRTFSAGTLSSLSGKKPPPPPPPSRAKKPPPPPPPMRRAANSSYT